MFIDTLFENVIFLSSDDDSPWALSDNLRVKVKQTAVEPVWTRFYQESVRPSDPRQN